MRLLTPALGLILLAGFSSSALADVYLCSDDTGKVSAQNQDCPAKAAEPDQSAAYAAMSEAQWDWYYSQVECIDRAYYDGSHLVGDPERIRLINRRLQGKDLPPYVEEQFEQAKEQLKREPTLDMPVYFACSDELIDNPEPDTGSSVSLLSRLQLDGLKTPNNQPALWLNWAHSRASEELNLLASSAKTAYFSSGERYFHAIDLASGREQWRYTSDGEVLEAAVSGERVFILTAGQPHLRVLDSNTGTLLQHYEQQNAVANLQLVGDLLLMRESSETAEYLVALDSQSLTERWRTTFPSQSSEPLQVVHDTLLAIDDDYVLHAYALSTGKQRWQQKMAEGGELTVGSQVYYRDDENTQIQVLSVDSGKPVTTYRFKEDDQLLLDGDSPLFYKAVPDSNRLQAIDPASGKTRWTFTPPASGAPADLRVAGPLLLIQDGESSALYIVDNQTGKLLDTLHTTVNFTELHSEQQTLLSSPSALLVFPR